MQEQIRFNRCQCNGMTLREREDIAPIRQNCYVDTWKRNLLGDRIVAEEGVGAGEELRQHPRPFVALPEMGEDVG
jgi:hypothetical protein